MDRITRVSIVGMGALGVLRGDFFTRTLGLEQVTSLADRDRAERYRDTTVYCNGRGWKFAVCPGDEADPGGPAQLLIFAVKATALEASALMVRNQVRRDTVIPPVLNGITSEAAIGSILGMEHVPHCVAQGMNAAKMGSELTYSRTGQICIRIPQHEPQKGAMLEAVTKLLERTELPYTRESDILRRLWCKQMLNVGVNQAIVVEEGTYGAVQRPGPARQTMKATMAEVVELAGGKGIRVTMEDLDVYVDLIDSLNPDGTPSMRQDGLACRPLEMEFFAGTVIRRTEAAGLDVPVNRELHRRIEGMERC